MQLLWQMGITMTLTSQPFQAWRNGILHIQDPYYIRLLTDALEHSQIR